jgi:transcriptional regulator with XRE-family HTH domain
MDKHNKDRNDLVRDLGFKYPTLSDWINGKIYPRIDKIEILANYFGIEKSDLIEERSDKQDYYINNETKKIAQQIHDNKELRMLFDAGRNAKPEDLLTAQEILLSLKKRERKEYEEYNEDFKEYEECNDDFSEDY